MAAGLGFKDFTTGEVLTAADVDGYLMQGIWVFASAAARDAAVTSPQEGNFAFTKDTNGLWYYDGAAWVASGATGDIEGVTAGIGISGGGTSGTVTITNSMATAIDAKGDLVAGTGADTFARLAIGANDTVLTADSSTATGLKWSAPAAGGMTLLSTTSLSGASTLISSISTSYTDLKIVMYGLDASTADYVYLKPNDVSDICNFGYTIHESSAGSSTGGAISANLYFYTSSGLANTSNSCSITFSGYANTNFNRKPIIWSGGYSRTFNNSAIVGGGFANVSTGQITSLRIGTNSGNLTGTVLIYGVK